MVQEQQEFLAATARLIQAASGDNYWWWCTAATDRHQEGDWRWPHSGRPVASFGWSPGYPRGAAGWNCQHLGWDANFRWKDSACTGHTYPLCQKKVFNNTVTGDG